jgi:hypothetical protein
MHMGRDACELTLTVRQVNQKHLGSVRQEDIVLLGCLNVSKGAWQVVFSVRSQVDTALASAPPATDR